MQWHTGSESGALPISCDEMEWIVEGVNLKIKIKVGPYGEWQQQ